MMTRLARANDAFTLLDTLVALAVAGLAGSLLVGLMTFVLSSATRLRADTQMASDTIAIQRVLAALTREASSPAATGLTFYGNESSFTFASRGPALMGLDRPTAFEFVREPAEQANQLTLLWKDPATGAVHRETIARDIETLAFSYFGASKRSEKRQWHSSWQPDRGQPEALKLSVKFRSAASDLDFVAPMRATVPIACLRNPRHIGCQESAK